MPQHAHRFLQPVFRVRYEREGENISTFPPDIDSKHQLGTPWLMHMVVCIIN